MTEAIDPTTLTVGVLGGTGAQGKGLALRWAKAGIRLIIGSRAAERAEASAAEHCQLTGTENITGADNATCAAQADVVLAAVPWESHADTLTGLVEPLRGKIFIDCVNPLGFDKNRPVPAPGRGGQRRPAGRAVAPRDPGDGRVP
ncbi:NAD(P)-binding domain-containing protein [Actinomycetospora termitidis]|uniref:NAD(P)-binding domain-containing protein n=1 Tax=Actinomycetospora termitidis TaxID=3053470 RepID=A0ABT7MG17_9PSEU|nr:NAD(P)-binding domain-containing protein [Actinomycetospora sp. Odt1-22]MDL5159616.1 NAD(P)-binding domain-containing protein [Actinomycetospora sp. Odt1-22]